MIFVSLAGRVKSNLCDILKKDISPSSIKLLSEDRSKTFEDEATIGDQEIENDAVVWMEFSKKATS